MSVERWISELKAKSRKAAETDHDHRGKGESPSCVHEPGDESPPTAPPPLPCITPPWGCSRCYHHYERGNRCGFLRYAYRGRVIPAEPERCPMINYRQLGFDEPKYGIKVSFLNRPIERTSHA